MEALEFQKKIQAVGIIPVIALSGLDEALPLADALLDGGIPVIEITFRTKAAAEAIRLLAQERPQLLVGAGTVLSRETAELAFNAGARFALAPGLNPTVVKAAGELGLPFVPGIATPSEIELALSLGCRTLKLFPAGLLGGVEAIKALSGPYGHTGVRFIPTGGVTQENLGSYLACESVVAVGGTWLARKEDLVQGRWSEVKKRAAAAMAIVSQLRN